VDGFGLGAAAVALVAGAFSVLCQSREPEDSALNDGEYHSLILLAVAGMAALAAAHDFLTLVVALELMSIATYLLAGSRRSDLRSNEAALKYVILGGFSSAFLMLGAAFIYGAAGSLDLRPAWGATLSDGRRYLALAGLGLLLAGMLFKAGAVPFHFWLPDVYEGAPTGVTALMAAGVKVAVFAVLARLVFGTFGAPEFREALNFLLAAAAVVTMAWGNLAALQQSNLKRLLAYSAIAHTGYLLLAFLMGPKGDAEPQLHAALFYLAVYAAMTLGAFGVISLVRERDGRALERMDDYAGLAREHPVPALCMSLFLLSLAGMPPLGGFFAKFLVFRQAIGEGFIAPAVLGILASAVSFYYYLAVIRRMYMVEAPAGRPARCLHSWTLNLVILAAALATLLLGLWPHLAW
jgi:NADH-quinone oxidoreductase subunit N